MTPHIKVWRFQDAPAEYQDMSTNGGDEDWIALVPAELVSEYISWLEPGSNFGCCDVSTYRFEDGSEIHIGSHA